MSESCTDSSEMPSMGFGTGLTDVEGDVEMAVEYAIDTGYRFIDCAWSYGTEKRVGRAIRRKLDEKVVKRSDLYISTKLSNFHHSQEDVRRMIMESLQNLQLNYLDLYIMQWPISIQVVNDSTTYELLDHYSDVDYLDTWHAMEECYEAGLARGIGVANFNSVQIERLIKFSRYKPIVNEIELHPFFCQKKLHKFCRDRDIKVVAFYPLGFIERPLTYGRILPLTIEHPVIEEIARRLDKTPSQIVYKYLISHLAVSVVHSTVYPPRIRSDFELHDFTLEDADIKAIESLNSNKRVNLGTMYERHQYYPFNIEY